jgi:hypothetical protein
MLIDFDFLGPTSEPECDAAVTSLVEMGFDAVCKSHSSILLIHSLFFFCFSGKSSFSIINNALEYQ